MPEWDGNNKMHGNKNKIDWSNKGLVGNNINHCGQWYQKEVTLLKVRICKRMKPLQG